MRWRWRVMQVRGPDRVGKWQSTREAARDAAVRAGVAKKNPDGSYFFDVLTSIEEMDQAPRDT